MKRVVIVGGGFVGLTAAAGLRRERGLYVVMIDMKEYFEWKPGVLRRMVESESVPKIHAQWDADEFICGKVTQLNPTALIVQTTEPNSEPLAVTFDFCLICTGSDYQQPIVPSPMSVSTAKRKEEMLSWQGRICQAKSILIVGGGLVAIELAGEIVDSCPGAAVTLATSKSTLLERMPLKAGLHAASWLRARGVNIFYEMRMLCTEVQDSNRQRLIYSGTSTNGGGDMTVEVELAFECTGSKPLSSFMHSTMPESLATNGAIKVGPTLQVAGHPTIFAAGDVCTLEGETADKMGLTAQYAGNLVCRNIIRLMKSSQLLHYPDNAIPGGRSPNAQVISLGSKNGIIRVEDLVICGRFIPPFAKKFTEYLSMKAIRGHPIFSPLFSVTESLFCIVSLWLSLFSSTPTTR